MKDYIEEKRQWDYRQDVDPESNCSIFTVYASGAVNVDGERYAPSGKDGAHSYSEYEYGWLVESWVSKTEDGKIDIDLGLLFCINFPQHKG